MCATSMFCDYVFVTKGEKCDNRLLWLVIGDIEIFAYDNHHLKYHGYCKYRNTSKLVVTVR